MGKDWKSCESSEVVNVFKKLEENTGLKMNYEKSVIHRIGMIKDSDQKLATSEKFKWSNSKVLSLGIHTLVDDEINENYTNIIDKTNTILRIWRMRDLILIGKVSIVNSLVASLFIYKMQILQNIPDEMIHKLEQIIEHFIWNACKPKLKLKFLQSKKEDGGLRLAIQRSESAH